MVQSVKHWILDLSFGLDLRVISSSSPLGARRHRAYLIKKSILKKYFIAKKYDHLSSQQVVITDHHNKYMNNEKV